MSTGAYAKLDPFRFLYQQIFKMHPFNYVSFNNIYGEGIDRLADINAHI